MKDASQEREDLAASWMEDLGKMLMVEIGSLLTRFSRAYQQSLQTEVAWKCSSLAILSNLDLTSKAVYKGSLLPVEYLLYF